MGKRYGMRIDHSGMKYLFGKSSLNVIQIKWLEFLSEYEFDIRIS
jgi:hypothetical protein